MSDFANLLIGNIEKKYGLPIEDFLKLDVDERAAHEQKPVGRERDSYRIRMKLIRDSWKGTPTRRDVEREVDYALR